MTRAKRKKRGLTWTDVVAIGLALPGMEEGTSYGTPALKVAGKLAVRLKEDGETLVLRTDFDSRDLLLQADPACFFFTEHYRAYPMVLVRLAAAQREVIAPLLEEAWRQVAPKKLLAVRP